MGDPPTMAPVGFRINQPHRIPLNWSGACNTGTVQFTYHGVSDSFTISAGLARKLGSSSHILRALSVRPIRSNSSIKEEGLILEGSPMPGGTGFGFAARGIRRLTEDKQGLTILGDKVLRIMAGYINMLRTLGILGENEIDVKRFFHLMSRDNVPLIVGSFLKDPLNGFKELILEAAKQKLPVLLKVKPSVILKALTEGLDGEYLFEMSPLTASKKRPYPNSLYREDGYSVFKNIENSLPYRGRVIGRDPFNEWWGTNCPPKVNAKERLLIACEIALAHKDQSYWIDLATDVDSRNREGLIRGIPLGSKGAYYLLTFINDEDENIGVSGSPVYIDSGNESDDPHSGVGLDLHGDM